MSEIVLKDMSESKVRLVKQLYCKEASDDELDLFIYTCNRTGLDPLARQIYAVFRNNSKKVGDKWIKTKEMQIQTAIDGFRVVAERSGTYAGQDKVQFEYSEDPKEKWHPSIAFVSIYRFSSTGQRFPAAVGEARWEEFCQKDKEGHVTSMWKKMPHTMLAKCAESNGLRKAFPQDLSGLYTTEEMMQSESSEKEEKIINDNKKIESFSSEHDSLKIYAKSLELAETGDKNQWWEYVKSNKTKLSKEEYDDLIIKSKEALDNNAGAQ